MYILMYTNPPNYLNINIYSSFLIKLKLNCICVSGRNIFIEIAPVALSMFSAKMCVSHLNNKNQIINICFNSLYLICIVYEGITLEI